MRIELPSIEAIKLFVAMGNGVALVPKLTVARELQTRELVAVTVDELEVRRLLRLVYRRNVKLSYAATAFLQTVRGMAAETGPPFHYQVER
jgi:DNA-binding transcriptional LysR family regulator